MTERRIPDYDAVNDPHCTYTQESRNFRKSPFIQMQQEAKGGGQGSRGRVGTPSSSFNGSSSHSQLQPLEGGSQPAVLIPPGFAGVGFGTDLSRGGTPSVPPSQLQAGLGQYEQQEAIRTWSAGGSVNFEKPTGGQWAAPAGNGLTPSSRGGGGQGPQGAQGVALESMQQECVEAIEAREMLLRRLYGAQLDQAQALGMVRLLRAATLRVVETVAAWHRAVRGAMDESSGASSLASGGGLGLPPLSREGARAGTPGDPRAATAAALCPVPFKWQGINYLLKLMDDTAGE